MLAQHVGANDSNAGSTKLPPYAQRGKTSRTGSDHAQIAQSLFAKVCGKSTR